jgi:hypothetical protein
MITLGEIALDLDEIAAAMGAWLTPDPSHPEYDRKAYALRIAIFAVQHQADRLREIEHLPAHHPIDPAPRHPGH